MQNKPALIILLIALFSVIPITPFMLSSTVAKAQSQPTLYLSPNSASIYYGTVTVTASYSGFNGTPTITWSTPTNAITVKQINSNTFVISANQINAGTYIITFSALSMYINSNGSYVYQQANAQFTLTILPATFSLSASPQSITVVANTNPRAPGQPGQVAIGIQSSTDPYQTITLSSNASFVSFSSQTASPGQTVTAYVSPRTTGNYTVVITGKNNDGVVENTTIYVSSVFGAININGTSISGSNNFLINLGENILTGGLISFGYLISQALGGAIANLATWVGGPDGIYNLLIQLPAPNNPNGKPYMLWNAAIMPLYWKVTDVVLFFFVFVLFIAGLEWALENFNIMRPGTALSLLTGSAITLILLYLFPYIYAFVAEIFNDITYPANNVLLPNGAIYTVIWATIGATPTAGLSGLVAIILSVIFFVLDIIVLLMIGIMGILRIFFIGAFIVLMPLFLVLRLIPFTKHIAEEMISMLIGLMVSSLLVAIFFAFAYAVVQAMPHTYFAQFGALATLFAGALMPTVMAPRLGRIFETTGMAITGATMTGAMVGAMGAAGAAGGAVAGVQGIASGGAGALASARGWGTGALAQKVANLKIGGKPIGLENVQAGAKALAGGEIMGRNVIGGAISGIGRAFGMTPHIPGGAHMPFRAGGQVLGTVGENIQLDPAGLAAFTQGHQFESVIGARVAQLNKMAKVDLVKKQPMNGIDYHASVDKMSPHEFTTFFKNKYGLELSEEHVPEAKKFLHSLSNFELYQVMEHPKLQDPKSIDSALKNYATNVKLINDKRTSMGYNPLYKPKWDNVAYLASRKSELSKKNIHI